LISVSQIMRRFGSGVATATVFFVIFCMRNAAVSAPCQQVIVKRSEF
jgi:hypothetical protein